MTPEEWKQKYYSVPASGVAKEDAVMHSLKKWLGFREEMREIFEVSPHLLESTSSSCALCVHHLYSSVTGCATCPLYKIRGNVSCDRPTSSEKVHPYASFMLYSNPEPMIEWLKRVVELEEKTWLGKGRHFFKLQYERLKK